MNLLTKKIYKYIYILLSIKCLLYILDLNKGIVNSTVSRDSLIHLLFNTLTNALCLCLFFIFHMSFINSCQVDETTQTELNCINNQGKRLFSQYITGHEILCGGHSLITEHTQKDDVDPIFVETHAQTIESGELLICTAVQTDATVLSIPLLFTENLLSETYSSGENLMESFSQTLLSLNRNGDNQ